MTTLTRLWSLWINQVSFALFLLPSLCFVFPTLSELPVRLAKRIVELESLPYGLSHTEPVMQVRSWYEDSFSEVISTTPPSTPEEDDVFTDMLENILQRHADVVPMLARVCWRMMTISILYQYYNYYSLIPVLITPHLLSCHQMGCFFILHRDTFLPTYLPTYLPDHYSSMSPYPYYTSITFPHLQGVLMIKDNLVLHNNSENGAFSCPFLTSFLDRFYM